MEIEESRSCREDCREVTDDESESDAMMGLMSLISISVSTEY